MKPNFALILSFDGIRLLHRAPAGWLRVGEVALDSADLAGALADLRATALRLDPAGIRAKLVIPNEQIRYLSIDHDGLDEDALPARVAQALDGATPYAVSDLSFDWTVDGAQVHIAAVARETLDEAEGFALEHEFGPVSFVAIPPDGAFSGEPFFGAAPSSASWLDATDSLSRDLQPIHVIGDAELPEDSTGDAVPADSVDSVDTATQDTPAMADVAGDAPKDTLADAPPPDEARSTPDTPEESVTPPLEDAALDDTPLPTEDEPTAAPPEPAPVQAPEAERPALAVPSDTPEVPAFASIRAARDIPPAPKVSATAPVIDLEDDDLPDAPALTGQSPAAKDEAEVRFSAPARTADKTRRAGLGAFFSRRGQPTRETPPPVARPAPQPQPRATIPPAPPDLDQPAPVQAVAADPEAERQRMTIFGARKPAKPKQQVGGKPRYLGLILTAALLLFLAGVAAWASIFSEDGLSRLLGPRETETVALPDEALPPIDTLEIEGPEAAGDPDETELAAIEPGLLPSDAIKDIPEALATPAEPQELTPEEAAVRYAATGIWQMAPEQPESPGFSQLDDLYTASIDPSVNMGDAVALPPLSGMMGDRMLGQQASPAAPGTDFDLDDRGLVRATPEGAVTPDGILVIAGRPPVLPASLPTRFEETPELDTAAQTRLAAFRPRARPGDLVQQNERSNLGGLTRDELAQIRPRLRPDLPKAEAEEDQTATEQAVAASIKPRVRPSNFAQIVQRAQRAQPSEPEVVQTAAAVAPRTVSPSVPSSANVAREATVRNALRLNRVNLIGVYGKPSSRRALVRMSNGRYVKVQVGDRLDGGRVQAIGESELRYTKGGRSVTLTMPRG